MKTLFEKHRDALTEGSHFIDGQVRGLLIHDAIDKSVEITKEELENILIWYQGKGDEYRGKTLVIDCVNDYLQSKK